MHLLGEMYFDRTEALVGVRLIGENLGIGPIQQWLNSLGLAGSDFRAGDQAPDL